MRPVKGSRESSAQTPRDHGHIPESLTSNPARLPQDSLCIAPAIPFRSFPPTLSAIKRHRFPCCPGTELRRWEPPALLHRLFHPRTGPAAKVFGREGRGEGEPFSKKVSLPASFSPFKSSGVCLPSPKQKIPGGAGTKKDPLALRAARGSRTIFGSGLLSHMTLCSIIGDGELNFRVRNGVGCTLSSMATKEIWQIY